MVFVCCHGGGVNAYNLIVLTTHLNGSSHHVQTPQLFRVQVVVASIKSESSFSSAVCQPYDCASCLGWPILYEDRFFCYGMVESEGLTYGTKLVHLSLLQADAYDHKCLLQTANLKTLRRSLSLSSSFLVRKPAKILW